MALSLGLGFKYGRKDLAFAWFVQTFAFVTFNKVCTSQVGFRFFMLSLYVAEEARVNSTSYGTFGFYRQSYPDFTSRGEGDLPSFQSGS
jgi:hypothetical protein